MLLPSSDSSPIAMTSGTFSWPQLGANYPAVWPSGGKGKKGAEEQEASKGDLKNIQNPIETSTNKGF